MRGRVVCSQKQQADCARGRVFRRLATSKKQKEMHTYLNIPKRDQTGDWEPMNSFRDRKARFQIAEWDLECPPQPPETEVQGATESHSLKTVNTVWNEATGEYSIYPTSIPSLYVECVESRSFVSLVYGWPETEEDTQGAEPEESHSPWPRVRRQDPGLRLMPQRGETEGVLGSGVLCMWK